MMGIYELLLDFLFPKHCFGCGKLGEFICAICISNITPSNDLAGKGICALFAYRDPVMKKILWKLKYAGTYGIASLLGALLYDRILEDLAEKKMFNGHMGGMLVMPIPLSKKSFRKRGFNQSALIARAVCKNDTEHICVYTDNALYKVRETEAQMSLKNRRQRLDNLKNAFSAKRSVVDGKDIVLIDDITTTGATIAEARKALLAAGAKSVAAYTIAH